MIVDPDEPIPDSTEEIVEKFVRRVVKTDETIVEEGKENVKTSAELKIFVAEKLRFSLDNIQERIEEKLRSDSTPKPERDFFESHGFSVNKINRKSKQLIITTYDYNRNDEFIAIEESGYYVFITNVKRSWTKRTVENLIKYIDGMDRAFLTTSDLEELVGEPNKRDLTGFTAKYQPFYEEKYVSIQVHGGTDQALTDIKSDFDARPTRVVYSQRNSPSEAVKGAVNQEGYASVERVRQGSEDAGVETVMSVIERCISRDKNNFSVDFRPEREAPGEQDDPDQSDIEKIIDRYINEETDGGGIGLDFVIHRGSVLEGMTVCELKDDIDTDNYPDDESIASQLESTVLEKQRYEYTGIDEKNYIVYDKKTYSSFEVVVMNGGIRVYARSNTEKITIRQFYKEVSDDFNVSYNIENVSQKVRV